MSKRIVTLPGDGIGPEIMPVAIEALNAVGADFEYEEHLFGGASIDAHGTALTDETMDACKAADAVLLAAVGGPKWDTTDPSKPRPEQGLLGLRKAMGLFANLRPVRTYPELIESSPLKNQVVEGTDMIIVRELTGGLYYGQPHGIELSCANRIPHGRGLGSSAAAIVAGLVAARALAGASTRPQDVLPLASMLEGHPDNVAPCLFGGLTIAWVAAGAARLPEARAVRLDPHPAIRPVAFIAPGPVSTKVARGLLPPAVPHADAARNAGRAALLIAALTARPDVLLDGTEDKLHQDYRAPAMPHTHELVTRLRAAGVPAVVSGAGPSALAFLTENPGQDDLRRLDSIAAETGIDWHISPLVVECQGASVTSGAPSARRS